MFSLPLAPLLSSSVANGVDKKKYRFVLRLSVERVKGFRIRVGDQPVHHLQGPRSMRRHGMSRRSAQKDLAARKLAVLGHTLADHDNFTLFFLRRVLCMR